MSYNNLILWKDIWNQTSLYKGFFDEEICAGYPADTYDKNKEKWITTGGKDSCNGDSGGGLICDYNGKAVLMATVSHGKGCAQDGYPGVYVRIDKNKDWIDNGECQF